MIAAKFYETLRNDPESLGFLCLPQAPDHIDIEVTGECVFRCANCWGPRHTENRPRLSPDDWIEILAELQFCNTSGVTITGGEPLRYRGIVELTRGLHELGLNVTLSTTGHDPDGLLPQIFPYIHQLGIPIDSIDADVNAMWRRSKSVVGGGLEHAIAALKLAENYPHVDVTLRSVVMAQTIGGLALLPSGLEDHGVITENIRWKLYELNTKLGPRKNRSLQFSVEGSDVASALDAHTGRFKEIIYQEVSSSINRYFLIGQNGDCRFISDINGVPEELEVGNIYDDFMGVMRNINVDNYRLLVHVSNGAWHDLRQVYPDLGAGISIDEVFEVDTIL